MGIYGLTEILFIIIIMNQMNEDDNEATNLIFATVTNDDEHGAMLLGHPVFYQNADSVVDLHQIARPFALLAVFFHDDQLLSLSLSITVNMRLSWSLRLCQCDLHCSPKSSDSS